LPLSGVSIKIFCEKEIAVPCYRKLSLCEVPYVALRRITLAIELNVYSTVSGNGRP